MMKRASLRLSDSLDEGNRSKATMVTKKDFFDKTQLLRFDLRPPICAWSARLGCFRPRKRIETLAKGTRGAAGIINVGESWFNRTGSDGLFIEKTKSN